jgi:hypothetical protein
MSIRIEKPTQDDPQWTVYIETEPNAGVDMIIGVGPTQATAIDDARLCLRADISELERYRRETRFSGE